MSEKNSPKPLTGVAVSQITRRLASGDSPAHLAKVYQCHIENILALDRARVDLQKKSA